MPEGAYMTVLDNLERVWLIECSRCANTGESWAMTGDGAATELVAQGWSEYCPACNEA